MTGKELEKILQGMKVSKAEIAKILGVQITQVNQIIKVKDVKTGYLERLCECLDVKLDFFYKNTKYWPTSLSVTKSVGDNDSDMDWRAKFEEEREKKVELEGKYGAMCSAYNMLLDKITELSSRTAKV